jgi:hypothetical protein
MFEWKCLHHLIKLGAPDRGDWQVPGENNQILTMGFILQRYLREKDEHFQAESSIR